MDLVQIIILALLVEAIWETLKICWQKGEFSWDRMGCLTVAVFLSVLCGANLLSAVGLIMGPYWLGSLCTGNLASRGSNFLHDLLSKLQELKGKSA